MSLPVIAFITGGYSGEAEISYKSAVTIENNLDQQKFKVYKNRYQADGWIHTLLRRYNSRKRDDFSLTIEGEKISFDAVLIGIHGTPVKMENCRVILICSICLTHHVMPLHRRLLSIKGTQLLLPHLPA
jgi:D-alanine-D-alanine ligase-like ATP-grasp enzyme